MSQGRLSLVKKFRLSPDEAAELAEKAEKMNMTESEYLRFMISQKPTDYPEMRILFPRATSQSHACMTLTTAARVEYLAHRVASNFMPRCLRRGI